MGKGAIIMDDQTGPQAVELDGVYRLLQRHLDDQAVGFPVARSGADLRFLAALFTPDEARMALRLTYRPAPQVRVLEDAAPEFPSERALSLLESAFSKGAIGWKMKDGAAHWYLLPVVIGIYEAQDGQPSRAFLEAAGAYMQTREYRRSFAAVKPSQMRTIPIGLSVSAPRHVATYDDIRSLVVSSKGPLAILRCICREESRLEGKPCRMTSRMETCLAMGDMASSILRRGHGREITAGEALEILRRNEEDGLVLQPANERQPEFVCSCCGCCCGMLGFQKALPNPADFWAANHLALVDSTACTGCGVCLERCQVNAVSLTGPDGRAVVDGRRCIGCGLCVPTCPSRAITLVLKEKEAVPPQDEEELYDRIRSNRRYNA